MSVTHDKQHVQHANDSNFRNLVLNSGAGAGRLLCRLVRAVPAAGPMLAELAAENPGVRVVKVNVDDSPVVGGPSTASSRSPV